MSVLAIGVAASVAACGGRAQAPAPPSPSPSAAPMPSEPVVPPGARPFGLPVDVGPASVVLRDLKPYLPYPPIPGHEGTPVRIQVVVVNNARGGTALPVGAALRDPTSGRDCVEHFTPGARHAAEPGRTTHLAFSFLCPEVVRHDLLATVSVGPAHQSFYGPFD